MKFLLLALFFPQESEDFDFTLDIKTSLVLSANEPDLILEDYSNYDGIPLFGVGANMDLNLPWRLEAEVNPYFWYSQKNKMAKIGLKGELRWDVWEDDFLEIGWRHHSWHNADADSPRQRGRLKDSAFARINACNLDLGEEASIRFFPEVAVCIKSTDPIEVKDVYIEGEEDVAVAEFALLTVFHCRQFDISLRPHFQFGENANQYGATGEIAYSFTKNIAIFTDFNCYQDDVDSDYRYVTSIGVILRFR